MKVNDYYKTEPTETTHYTPLCNQELKDKTCTLAHDCEIKCALNVRKFVDGVNRGGSRHSQHSHRRMSDFLTEILYCKQSTPQSYNFSFTYLKEYNKFYLIASISNCLVPINQGLELIVKQ